MNIFWKKYYKNFQYAYQFGLCLTYNLSKSVSIFSSVTFLDNNFTPEKGEIVLQKGSNTQIDGTTFYTVNNTKQEISFNDTQQPYRKQMTYNGNAINYSIGFCYKFNKKEKKPTPASL